VTYVIYNSYYTQLMTYVNIYIIKSFRNFIPDIDKE